MSQGAGDPPGAPAPEDIEQAVLESLRALYREEDVRRCLASRTTTDAPTEPWSAYRLKPWQAREHWPVSLVDEHVPPGGRILVVGCGTGRMCGWFADAGYAVTGIDILEEFIAAARQAVGPPASGVWPTFLAIDGYRWPLEGGRFEGVAMMATFLAHCPTPQIRQRLFAEASRVLRPGGCLLAEAADRTHPGFQPDPRSQRPSRDPRAATSALDALRGLPGVSVGRFHPFRTDATAATATAWYAADPRELWVEVEAAGLRVIRVQTEQEPADACPCVTVVATKPGPPST